MKKTILTSLALIGFLITHSVAHADFITAPVQILNTATFQPASYIPAVTTAVIANTSSTVATVLAPVASTTLPATTVNTQTTEVFFNETATTNPQDQTFTSSTIPAPIYNAGVSSSSTVGNNSLLTNTNNEVTTPESSSNTSTPSEVTPSNTHHITSGTLITPKVTVTPVVPEKTVYVKKTFTVIPETEMVSEQVTEDVSNHDYSGTASVYGITAGITLIGVLAIIASILGIAVLAREYRARNNRKIA